MRVLVTGGTGYLGGAIVRGRRSAVIRLVFARDRPASAACQSRVIDGDVRESRPSRGPREGAMPSVI